MQCMHPRLIRNPGWNFGDPNSPESFQVPCGHCVGCRIARTREWAVRLLHELDTQKDGIFVTLTYNNDNLPADLSLHKEDLQKFFKRLRKSLNGRRIKYYACGEYGENPRDGDIKRPHYHAIIYGLSPKDKHYLDSCWSKGFITVGTVTYYSCKYVSGYVQKKLYGKDAREYQDRTPPFMVCSNAIGLDYVLRNKDRLLKDKFVTVQGTKLALPRYYRVVLGIDTLEYYESTQEHRDAVRKVFQNRLDAALDCDHIPDEVYEHEIGRLQYESRLQYEKNMEAKLSLHDRSKC